VFSEDLNKLNDDDHDDDDDNDDITDGTVRFEDNKFQALIIARRGGDGIRTLVRAKWEWLGERCGGEMQFKARIRQHYANANANAEAEANLELELSLGRYALKHVEDLPGRRVRVLGKQDGAGDELGLARVHLQPDVPGGQSSGSHTTTTTTPPTGHRSMRYNHSHNVIILHVFYVFVCMSLCHLCVYVHVTLNSCINNIKCNKI